MVKVQDVAYVRFSAPDLDKMRTFLVDFGLRDAEDVGDGVLRMRGTGTAPYIHETVQGDAGLVAVGLRVATVEELEHFAADENAYLMDCRGPGGGKKVAVRDPNGFTVEIVAGQLSAPERNHGVRGAWNSASLHARRGTPKRVKRGPSHVHRLGHVVLGVEDVEESWAWWQSRFGLIMSDEIRTQEEKLVAAFIRCDRGEEPTDHHSLNFAAIPGSPKFHHAAFEVADLDDLMAGHEHLNAHGYTHEWGIGRHVLGSQVFDYWKDPWGHRVEHWTDGDLFAADTPTNVTDVETMMGLQWGAPAPANFAS